MTEPCTCDLCHGLIEGEAVRLNLSCGVYHLRHWDCCVGCHTKIREEPELLAMDFTKDWTKA